MRDGAQSSDGTERDDVWWDWAVHAQDDLYRDANMEWGYDAQMAKAAEEFSELAAVCARDLNGQADPETMLSELVDARIMMEQIAQYIVNDRLEEMCDEKLAELGDRLYGGESA